MASFHRAQERRPSSNAPEVEETDNNNANFNGRLPRDPEKLAVTSSLHPFWYTKRGYAVVGLVVLTVIGGIVGGAKAHAPDSERLSVSSTSSSASTTSSTSSCQPSNHGSSTLSLTFSTATNPSGTVSRAISSATLSTDSVITTPASASLT